MSAICVHCCEPIGEQSWLLRVQSGMHVADAYHERCWQEANGLVAAPSAAVYNQLRVAIAEKEDGDGRAFTAHARAWLRRNKAATG